MQADAHLRFAPDWDVKYEEELMATKGYPKSVLSSYPPGFSQGELYCSCEFQYDSMS
jgi:hypothetical protein